MNSQNTDINDPLIHSCLAPPENVTIMITNQCNLSCGHCLPESRLSDKTPFLPAASIIRLMKDFVSTGVKEICLTGGEPLLHPDWFDILSAACLLPGLERIKLQTNATRLTDNDIKALSSLTHPGMSLQISLEGMRQESNDRIRGKGSFERIINGLHRLTHAGLGSKICVAFTETQHNFSEIPDVMAFLDNLGVAAFITGTLVLGGRAKNNRHLSPPTPEQYEQLLTRYESDSEFRELYKNTGNIAAIEWYLGRSHPEERQCRCIRTPYITADANMYPCIILKVDELAVSDVYHRPLNDIINEGVQKWRDLEKLHQKRSMEIEQCRDCPGRRHCSAGCMGRAYSVSGNFMEPEDRCELRKAVYSWSPSN